MVMKSQGGKRSFYNRNKELLPELKEIQRKRLLETSDIYLKERILATDSNEKY